MIVHRVLDAFFRTLDAVDAARERLDRVLGREPKPDPWAVEWPPIDDAPPGGAPDAPLAAPAASRATGSAKPKSPARVDETASDGTTSTRVKSARTGTAPGRQKTSGSDKKSTAAADKKAAAKSKAGRKKSTTSNRKGSVDKVGADLDSPRGRASHTRVLEAGLPIVDENAEAFGKRVLARALWALVTAERAGSEKGLTTNDMAALLHLTAGIEVFATNIGRACRDHAELIAESEPDGRTRRFILTPEGQKAALALASR
jgi:hypothetical protein